MISRAGLLLPQLLIAGSLLADSPGSALAGGESAVDAKLREWFRLSLTERVAIVAIGDSNQRFGGHGYSRAMPQALYKAFGCYGSSLLLYRQWAGKGEAPPAAAPDALAAQAYSYWYIPPGESAPVSWKSGLLIIPADHPLDVRGPLRFHFTYGTFPGEGGEFKPMVRRDAAPWTTVASAREPVNSGSDAYQLKRLSLDLPADQERDYPIQFMPSALKPPIHGPFLAASAMCENLDHQSGLAYHTLYASGGQSLVDMLNTFRNHGGERLAEFFSRVREPLNGSKVCLVMIHSGLNDRNERLPSAGPQAGLDSSSGEGYADNLQGIMETLRAAWVRAGGEEAALRFVFMPSHAMGEPDDSRLLAYRKAARTLAATTPNASMIDLARLVPYGKMVEDALYDGGKKANPHLDRKGYEAIANELSARLTER